MNNRDGKGDHGDRRDLVDHGGMRDHGDLGNLATVATKMTVMLKRKCFSRGDLATWARLASSCRCAKVMFVLVWLGFVGLS
jgi:hypothetical protein